MHIVVQVSKFSGVAAASARDANEAQSGAPLVKRKWKIDLIMGFVK